MTIISPVETKEKSNLTKYQNIRMKHSRILKNTIVTAVFACSLTACGNKDLIGFDEDQNEIRDDVDAHIESLTFLTPDQRDSLSQMAQVYQHLFMADLYTESKQPNEVVINGIRDEFEFASNCMLQSFGANRELFKVEFKTLRRKAADTDARADRVKEFSKLTEVVPYNPTHFEDNEDTCFYAKSKK
ncbi:MAG: hypothetical protein IJ078_11280 [Succinivibrionaceae bacterium]|nr:hypothetical protein [Succinivibrionaceae bacterium]